jgi:hypothetical protein
MNWKKHLLAVGAIMVMAAATGCTAAAVPQQQEPAAAPMNRLGGVAAPANAGAEPTAVVGVNRAMYVPFGKSSHVFVDQDNGTVFVARMPEEIYDVNGEKIGPEGLAKGNIVEIYGNGIMAESYPGQYNGVTKMQVVSEGSPADADQYNDLIDQIYQEPDPAEPPTLQARYAIPEAIVSAAIERGGYTWGYEDENGQMQNVVACGPHLLQMELRDLTLPGATPIELGFYPDAPKEVKVVRWPASQLGTMDSAAIEEGEPVAVETADGEYAMEAEPGYVYGVTGIWENGEVEYGFVALEKK